MRDRSEYFRTGLLAGLIVGTSLLQAADGADVAPGETTQESTSEEVAESNYGSGPRDLVDASAPHDQEAARLLQRAESFLKARRWDRAQEVLLFVLDRSADSLVRMDGGRLVPVAEEANRLLGQLPPDVLDLYRRQYGQAAERALADAVASGHRDQIDQVATQFRHTAAGQAALIRLASIHFDRGEFGLAARCYRLVDDALKPAIRVRAAYALAASGEPQQAGELLATLSDTDRSALSKTLPDGFDADRLIAGASASIRPAVALADWPMPFGDESGAAVARGGEPILLRRWFQPLTYRAPIQEQIDRTTLDLRDAGRAPIPAGIPLAVGDRVVFRTLRGIAVHAIDDGRLLWETHDRNSAERVLSADVSQSLNREQDEVTRLRFQFGPDPSGGSVDHRPLSNLLYRDGVYGLVSSDRERLYLVEDHASLVRAEITGGWPGQIETDEAGIDLASNRLVAYDLETGRPAWLDSGGLGGVADGPFAPPLAGNYFFGPPTPADGDLFVVAERDKEIRLIALDPASGLPRWERPVADAPAGLGQDRVRRNWPAQVAVADGVIVCPTTVGWLMGLDRASRSIIWAHRYSAPRSDRDANELNPGAVASQLNSRWTAAAPIISQGRVVYAPAEFQNLVCLDLSTGELSWQRTKGERDLYVAGVASGCVVVVGARSIEGIDLEQGTTRWTLAIPGDAAPPSGRSVLTKERLYLPLRGESLWEIDIASGRLVHETTLPAGPGTLGTLLMHRGSLLSFAASGFIAFEERTELVRSVTDRLNSHPDDVAAIIKRAELQHAEGETSQAASSLDRIDPDSLPADQIERFQNLRWDVLAALAKSAGDELDARLDELEQLAGTPERRFLVRRLRADRDAAAGKLTRAARGYLALLNEPADSELLEEEGGRRHVRLENWLAGRFEDLWNSSEGDSRGQLDQVIAESLQSTTDREERRRLATVFAFHPLSFDLQRVLASEELAEGRLAKAELRLLPLTRRPEDSIRVATLIDLSAAAAEMGLWSDADHWRDRAVATGGDAVADRLSDGPADGRREVPGWGDFRLSVVRSGNYIASESTSEIRPDQAELPFFRERRMRLQAQQDRLGVSGPGGRDLVQMIPLRSGMRPGTRSVVAVDGHVLFLLHRGVVQALSPVEGRILWSAPLDEETARGIASESPPVPMQTGSSMLGKEGLVMLSRSRMSMPAANASYVAVRGRRMLSIHDAATGDLLWTRSDVPKSVDVIGTDRFIYLLPRGSGSPTILRAVDGDVLKFPSAGKQMRQAVATVGDQLLLMSVEESFRFFDLRFGGRTIVSLFDPASGRTAWSTSFPPEALFDRLHDGRLAILTPGDGKLVAVEPTTGQTQPLGQVPVEVLRRRSEVVLVTDANSVYVIVNSGRISPTFYTAELPAVTANGEVFAFDAGTGELRWRREVSGQRLFCQEFDHMPALLFVDSERTQKGNQALWRVDLLALDKRTGKPVLDEPYYTGSTPFFRGLSVQPERESIELTAYHARLRLQAVPISPTEAGPDTAPVPPGD